MIRKAFFTQKIYVKKKKTSLGYMYNKNIVKLHVFYGYCIINYNHLRNKF